MKNINKLFLAFIVILLPVNAFAAGSEIVVCHDIGVLKAFRILGTAILIIKIVVPVIIILTSIIRFSKSVIFEDASSVKDAANLLIKKVIAGALIFFIPTLFSAVFSLANNYDKTKAQFTDCGKCLTSIKDCNNLIGKYK